MEHSPNGELAKGLMEAMKRMELTLGFKIKRTGRSSKFRLNNLLAGAKCGHTDCITCEQVGGMELPQCTKPNLVHKNICAVCNPGADGKAEQEEIRTDIPTTCFGETSR